MSNIVSFRAENFRSYKDEQEISFLAIDDDFSSSNFHTVELEDGKSIKLLNSAVIYGANAAGKSNIILAMKAFVYFVNGSASFNYAERLPYESFKLFSPDDKKEAIKFTIDFVYDKKYYRYSFSYKEIESENSTDVIFADESFYRCKKNEVSEFDEYIPCENIFIRNSDGIVDNDTTCIKLQSTKIQKKQLVMSRIGLDSEEDTWEFGIYQILTSIISIPKGIDRYYIKNNYYLPAANIFKDNSYVAEQMVRLIKLADTGISDIGLDYDYRNSKYKVRMLHRSEFNEAYLDMEYEESKGTSTLFNVGVKVLFALQKGSFLAFDEINIALHSNLFKLLVSLFHNPVSNPKGAQILFTTHDTSIVQNNYMRIDQIWFAEKNGKGESELFSAQDFQGVNTISVPFEAWYRSGKFGATPNIRQDIDYIINGDK